MKLLTLYKGTSKSRCEPESQAERDLRESGYTETPPDGASDQSSPASAPAPQASPPSTDPEEPPESFVPPPTGPDSAAVEIPAGWPTAHHRTLLGLARKINPTFAGTTRDEAVAVIEAELSRRANP